MCSRAFDTTLKEAARGCGGRGPYANSINLHQFARDGVVLLGRVQGVTNGRMLLAQDLKENRMKTDKFETYFAKNVDEFIAKNTMDVPVEPWSSTSSDLPAHRKTLPGQVFGGQRGSEIRITLAQARQNLLLQPGRLLAVR